MDQATASKTCSRCGRTKPLADFPPHNQRKDGRQAYCRSCARAENRALWILAKRHPTEFAAIVGRLERG
jgi:transposase